jgi:3-oxoacyl-[acyl-carrier protein] reductase
MRLHGKKAVITGAGAGYGAGMALRFAREGAHVACLDLDQDAARATAAAIGVAGGVALAVRCDVSDGASVAAAVADLVRDWDGFDILVNNAGITQKPRRLDRITEAEIDRLFAVNVKSLYHMHANAVPVLRRRGAGTIINIASVAALRPRPGMAWYNASKAAVISPTQTMAGELAPDRIRVNAIAPVFGLTNMAGVMFGADVEASAARMAEAIPLGRLCTPDDVAGAAVYLASDDASLVTGVILPVDGGRMIA